MKKTTFVFEGIIHAVEPLTVVIKDAVKTTGHRLPRNGGDDAPAYWPSSTIRGSFRAAAHEVAVAHAKSQTGEVPFDLADHFMLAQGVDIVGDLTESNPGAIDPHADVRKANPMMSLFGRWGMASKAQIGHGFPISENSTAMFGGGARTIMFERKPELLEFLDEGEQSRLEGILLEQANASVDIQALKDQMRVLKKEIRNAPEAEKKALNARIADLESAIETRKDEKGEARESIRRPLDQYEAIVAGADLRHNMTLNAVTDVELGFFIAALVKFARNPYMGGHRAHDSGRVSAGWDVKVWPEDALEPVVIGRVEFDSNGFRITGDQLNAAFSGWKSSEDIDFKRLKA